MMLTYEATSRFVQAGEYRVHYHEVGEGPVLLCMHGGAPGAYGWGNFGRNIEALARHFRVIVVDLPGYGKSDKPDVSTGRNKMYADTMVALFEALGLERVNVLGMATGGAVAIRLAADYPDVVDRLILVSAAGGQTMFGLRRRDSASHVYYGGDGPSLQKMHDYLSQLLYDPSLITDDVLWERYEASVDPEFMERAPEGRTPVRHTPPDLWKRLDEIQAQTLIVWGRENRAQSFENGVFMLSRIPHAQLHVFGECGLWVPYEKAEEFNSLVVNFLSGTKRRS
ncbi:alpha/beta fold hydrolase [Arthrobacter sp. Marseille-P9274]|uniref:alpha/beta fold hydrolase n=1 Tax=Arthrobacter sp. Marseille-P9274 TaxID=2866572 RepID=UPI0021C622A6|nr:alpha/beta hydrolase [Arthrobacter sp. Marseille-P9274]